MKEEKENGIIRKKLTVEEQREKAPETPEEPVVKLPQPEEKQKAGTLRQRLKRQVETGEIFTLGRYKGQPLDWTVLDRDGDYVLAIVWSCLDEQEYDSRGNVKWKNSSLRKWLNQDFYESSFNDEEKKVIVKAPKKAGWEDGEAGDWVTLLSNRQATLLKEQQAKLLFPAGHLDMHAYPRSMHNLCVSVNWWMRTEKSSSDVYYGSSLGIARMLDGERKSHLQYMTCYVRPVIWVKISD